MYVAPRSTRQRPFYRPSGKPRTDRGEARGQNLVEDSQVSTVHREILRHGSSMDALHVRSTKLYIDIGLFDTRSSFQLSFGIVQCVL